MYMVNLQQTITCIHKKTKAHGYFRTVDMNKASQLNCNDTNAGNIILKA